MLKSSKRSLRNSAGSDRPKAAIPYAQGGSNIVPVPRSPSASAALVRARLGLLQNYFLGIAIASLDQNKSTPPTPSIKPETFLPIVPRGTPD